MNVHHAHAIANLAHAEAAHQDLHDRLRALLSDDTAVPLRTSLELSRIDLLLQLAHEATRAALEGRCGCAERADALGVTVTRLPRPVALVPADSGAPDGAA